MREITRYECPECGEHYAVMNGGIQFHHNGCPKPPYEHMRYVCIVDVEDWLAVKATTDTEHLLTDFKEMFVK